VARCEARLRTTRAHFETTTCAEVMATPCSTVSVPPRERQSSIRAARRGEIVLRDTGPRALRFRIDVSGRGSRPGSSALIPGRRKRLRLRPAAAHVRRSPIAPLPIRRPARGNNLPGVFDCPLACTAKTTISRPRRADLHRDVPARACFCARHGSALSSQRVSGIPVRRVLAAGFHRRDHHGKGRSGLP
jgi:hypothetical protein